MLKKVGLILIGILFAVLAFPTVLPSTAHIERKVSIHNTPAVIYAVLIDFQQFRSWDPWSPMEPESTYTVQGQGVGSTYLWEGKKVGHGSMVISEVKENERIDVVLTFVEPFASVAQTHWSITDMGNGLTEVSWYYEQNMAYFQRYFGLTLDGMLGADFEKGLNKLKTRLEANPA